MKKENIVEIKKNIRKLVGVIVSDKMIKTRVVAIEEIRRHPIYLKSYKATSKIKAHDENNEYKTGDIVEIIQTRPLSGDKAWKIVRLIVKDGVKPKTEDETND